MAALAIREAGFGDPDFDSCLAIRLAVFVGEQNVPEAEERDAHDQTARHFLALSDGAPAATARVLRKSPGVVKITRVAVLQSARGAGIGAALMRHIEDLLGAGIFVLDAQTHAAAFYRRLGYRSQGETFLEAGIPHVHMVKAVET